MRGRRDKFRSLTALCCLVSLSAGAAPAKSGKPVDPVEPARAALRMLQFDKAKGLLTSAGLAGNANAQYLLALMYLNGVGVMPDPSRAHTLLESAADHGHAAAAYVLSAELAHHPDAAAGSARHWLERSAKLGYALAEEALKSGRPLLDRESVGASEPTLLAAWVIDCARKNDPAELRRLGVASVGVRDEFGRDALTHAAAADSVAAATVLLELGADVHAADQAGTTALMIASERPDTAMAELLLQHGADPQAADREQRTALFYAARANRSATLQALHRADAALDARDARGYNALDDALAVGADAAAAQLRSLGVHANLMTGELKRANGKFDPSHPGVNYRGWPALALAVSRDDAAGVQQLLSAGGDVNLRVPPGDPLVHVAILAHATDSLSLLLAHGANALAGDHSGHSVLWLAATRNDLAAVKALLSAGVNPDAHATNESTPLLAALGATNAEELVKLLLDAGASPDSANAQGHTPLMIASSGGQVAPLRFLLAHHARTASQDREHRTALWYAAAGGSRDCVAALLDAGATQEADDVSGLTALHAAAAQTDAAVLTALLTSDGRLDRRSSSGDTPLLIAAATGHTDAVRALLALKPDLNVQNHAGDTALITASRGGHTAICQILLAAGANVSLRNGAGVSAADIATGRGFAAIAKELKNKS
jgi:ankyrin repeat protein